jgi:outer membrane receptor protein involved in Fe transport
MRTQRRDRSGRTRAPAQRGTSALTWSLNCVNASGNYRAISSQITGNLYAQYTMPMPGRRGHYRLRLGVRNIANTAPPLSSSGYAGAMYNPYGRYLYANFKVDF